MIPQHLNDSTFVTVLINHRGTFNSIGLHKPRCSEVPFTLAELRASISASIQTAWRPSCNQTWPAERREEHRLSFIKYFESKKWAERCLWKRISTRNEQRDNFKRTDEACTEVTLKMREVDYLTHTENSVAVESRHSLTPNCRHPTASWVLWLQGCPPEPGTGT